MTAYSLYVTLGAGDATQNITPEDTVVVTVDASFGTTGTWLSLTPFGCTLSVSSGTDGSTVTITPTVGASNYYVTLRTRDNEFGVWQSSTISGTISAPPATPTYSVANASTNEGASATASVTTTNVANGTTLYWTVTAPSSDVSITSGSFTISENAGSFTIPAIADATTEGTEFYTINVRTGSTSGTVAASATLTINDTSTAPAPDTTPNAFAFTDQSNVALSSTITSNAITVSGINAPTSISVSGGTYSINGGAYTSVSGTVTNGQTVTVRHTSSASNSAAINTALTIGGVSDTFTSTTAAAATPTYSVSNVSTNEGASATASVNTANVANGTTLYWTVTAPPSDVSVTSGSFTISGNAGSFTISAIADAVTEGTEGYTINVRTGSTSGPIVAVSTLTINDTSTAPAPTGSTPNPFTFIDQANVAVSATITSNAITVSGIDTAAYISVSGGTYSINGGPYTSTSGTVTNGQTVSVRHTSSASNSAVTNTTLTIGGVSDTFTSTTTVNPVGSGTQGLQIFDASGAIILDTSTFTMKDLGAFTNAAVTTGVTIPVSNISENSLVFIANNGPPSSSSNPTPNAYLSGGNLVVTAPHAFNAQIRILDVR